MKQAVGTYVITNKNLAVKDHLPETIWGQIIWHKQCLNTITTLRCFNGDLNQIHNLINKKIPYVLIEMGSIYLIARQLINTLVIDSSEVKNHVCLH